MGVTEITLITPPESSPALETALATIPALTSLPNPKPEILAPADLTHETGTGELLRLEEVQKAITTDFVVLPCDLISEMEGTRLLQQWMTLNPLPAGSGKDRRQSGMAMFYPTHGLEGISHKKDETDFFATVPIERPLVPPPTGSLRSNIEQVVFNMPTDTLNDKLEEDKGFLRLRQSLMEKHDRVKMRMKHRDAGVYIFPQWVKDFARVNEKFDSISEDILGWWAKATWQDGLADKLGLREVLAQKLTPQSDGTEAAYLSDDDLDAADLSSTTSRALQSPQHSKQYATRVGDALAHIEQPLTIPALLAYVQPAPSKPLIRRVDTSSQLLAVSLYLAKQSPEHTLSHEHKVHPSAQLEQQTRVSQEDSLVGENVKLGFRSNVKESVIGANCEIGKNVRLTKCLLMDGVVVGDGVVLTSCIIGKRAKIEGMKAAAVEGQDGAVEGAGKKGKKKAEDEDDERTRLTECEVAPGFVVEAGTVAKEEKMMGFDTEGDLGDEDEDGVGGEGTDDFED